MPDPRPDDLDLHVLSPDRPPAWWGVTPAATSRPWWAGLKAGARGGARVASNPRAPGWRPATAWLVALPAWAACAGAISLIATAVAVPAVGRFLGDVFGGTSPGETERLLGRFIAVPAVLPGLYYLILRRPAAVVAGNLSVLIVPIGYAFVAWLVCGWVAWATFEMVEELLR